jgi:hypothetical protein
MPLSNSNAAHGMTSKMMNFGEAGVQPDHRSPPRNNQNKHSRHQYSPSAGYQSDPQVHASSSNAMIDTSESGLNSRGAAHRAGVAPRLKKNWG